MKSFHRHFRRRPAGWGPGIAVAACFLAVVPALGGVLKGTVKDTAGTALEQVNIQLTCLSGGVFADTTETDAAGAYSFAGFPMGSYKMTLSKSGFDTKDTLFAMPDDTLGIDFELVRTYVPRGTMHVGQEPGGAWVPEGNPHTVSGDVVVGDSLYIAPGCSVVVAHPGTLQVQGGLRLGRLGQERVFVTAAVAMSGPTSTAQISCSGELRLERTYLDARRPVVLICKTLALAGDSMYGQTEIKCGQALVASTILGVAKLTSTGSMIMDSVAYPGGSSGCLTRHFSAGSKLVIRNSALPGGVCMQYGQPVPNTLFFAAREIFLWNTQLPSWTVDLQARSSLRVGYCRTGRVIVHDAHAILTQFTHCDIDEIEPYGMDSLTDNVINWLRLCADAPDTVLEPPLRYNLIGGITHYCSPNVIYPGLMENVRVNAKGDSCDLWYNIKIGHEATQQGYQYMPSDSVDKYATGSASDGTDMGYGTGPTGAMPWAGVIRGPSRHRGQATRSFPVLVTVVGTKVTFIVRSSEDAAWVAVYAVTGREVFRSALLSGGRYTWSTATQGGGVYVARIVAGDDVYSRRFLLRR